MNEGKKFVGPPKGIFDLGHKKRVAKKLDALLNGVIKDSIGNIVGKIHYADGNTVFEIFPQQSGIRFADPIENDTGIAHAKGEVIHLQSSSFLVTTGYKLPSAPTGDTIKAKAGKWIALQDVPAIQNISGTDCYNVPQWPMPEPDNYDDPLNFWMFWPDPICV